MKISIKALLVVVTFFISIVASLIITLTLFTRGNTTIEHEVDRLSENRVKLSLQEFEAKLLKTHDTIQSVANATITRFPSLYPNSTDEAVTAGLKVSLLMENVWSFPAFTTRYNNGDVFFIRASTQPQVLVARSPGAFWNGSSANTPRFMPLLNQTRFKYDFASLSVIPSSGPNASWEPINVAKTTFVNSPNWNKAILDEPIAPNFLQVAANNLIARQLNRTQIFFYLMSTVGYDPPSSSSTGNFSAAKTFNAMLIFLDFIADDLKEFLIGDVSRSKLFVVDTNTVSSGGMEKVISQTPGGLTFETRNYTPGMALPQGCFPSSSKMGCFYNVSTHSDFHLLKLAIANGLPFDLPLNSSGSSRSEIRSIHFEDDRDGTEYVASVGKLSLRNYNGLFLRVYFFTPLDFFSGDLRRALNISLAVSFVVAVIVSIVGGYLGLHFALRGVELLAEKMYRDPWAATKSEKQELKEMLKHSTDAYQSFWEEKFEQNQQQHRRNRASKNKKGEGDQYQSTTGNDNNGRQSSSPKTRAQSPTPSTSSSANSPSSSSSSSSSQSGHFSSSFHEVLELEAEFVAFRSVIDLVRGFVVASGGLMPTSPVIPSASQASSSFSSAATNSSTIPPSSATAAAAAQSQKSSSQEEQSTILPNAALELPSNMDSTAKNNAPNSNNNNNNNNINDSSNSENLNNNTDASAARKKKRSVKFTADTVGGNDDEDEENSSPVKVSGEFSRKNAPAVGESFLRGSREGSGSARRFVVPDWSPTLAVNQRHPFFVATIRFMLLDRFGSSPTSSSGSAPTTMTRSRDRSSEMISRNRSDYSQPSTLDSANNTFADSRENQSKRSSNRNRHSPSLFDVSTLFQRLDTTDSSSSTTARSLKRIATTKLLFSRIISIACSVLLQSCGFSVLQFFGDSMICYFRLRNLYSTSNLVLRFIGILQKLQRQLGEGRYRERFSMRRFGASASGSGSIKSLSGGLGRDQEKQQKQNPMLAIQNQQQQRLNSELTTRRQEFLIKEFLGGKVIGSLVNDTGDDIGGRRQFTSTLLSTTNTGSGSQLSGSRGASAAENGDEQQQQQATATTATSSLQNTQNDNNQDQSTPSTTVAGGTGAAVPTATITTMFTTSSSCGGPPTAAAGGGGGGSKLSNNGIVITAADSTSSGLVGLTGSSSGQNVVTVDNNSTNNNNNKPTSILKNTGTNFASSPTSILKNKSRSNPQNNININNNNNNMTDFSSADRASQNQKQQQEENDFTEHPCSLQKRNCVDVIGEDANNNNNNNNNKSASDELMRNAHLFGVSDASVPSEKQQGDNGNDDNDDDDDDDLEYYGMQDAREDLSNRLVLKIVAGFSAGKLFVLNPDINKNKNTSGADVHDLNHDQHQHSTSKNNSNDNVDNHHSVDHPSASTANTQKKVFHGGSVSLTAATLFGAAVGESQDLCDLAPTMFFGGNRSRARKRSRNKGNTTRSCDSNKPSTEVTAGQKKPSNESDTDSDAVSASSLSSSSSSTSGSDDSTSTSNDTPRKNNNDNNNNNKNVADDDDPARPFASEPGEEDFLDVREEAKSQVRVSRRGRHGSRRRQESPSSSSPTSGRRNADDENENTSTTTQGTEQKKKGKKKKKKKNQNDNNNDDNIDCAREEGEEDAPFLMMTKRGEVGGGGRDDGVNVSSENFNGENKFLDRVDSKGYSPYHALMVMPLTLQQTIAETPEILRVSKRQRKRREIPIVDVVKVRKLPVFNPNERPSSSYRNRNNTNYTGNSKFNGFKARRLPSFLLQRVGGRIESSRFSSAVLEEKDERDEKKQQDDDSEGEKRKTERQSRASAGGTRNDNKSRRAASTSSNSTTSSSHHQKQQVKTMTIRVCKILTEDECY